jgi:predicted glycoside hydrolase/deacetylase ChbG (UPF0249 family)
MARLIINADDLGYSPTVNQAIADLHSQGIVTSASLMVNQPFSEAGAEIALQSPGLSIGVHLNLSKGFPLLPPSQVPSLVDERGRFWPSNQLFPKVLLRQIDWSEARAELDAQVNWALVRGLRLDNLDTHVHFHMLPPARRLTRNLARRYGVTAWRTPDPRATLLPSKLWIDLLAIPTPDSGRLAVPHYLISLHQWGQRLLTDRQLGSVLSRPEVIAELVVHPGYIDDPHLPLPDQLPPARRQVEVDLLTSSPFRAWLTELEVQLISYADLAALPRFPAI